MRLPDGATTNPFGLTEMASVAVTTTRFFGVRSSGN